MPEDTPMRSDPRLLDILAKISDSTISTRSYLESIINEHDKLYDTRFRAADIAVSTALASAEKAVTAAFLASEKAIVKAEQAQHDYNVRSNEFRGQLDDQAATLMPRTESNVLFRVQDERLQVAIVNMDAKLEVLRKAIEKNAETMGTNVGDLRESRSAGIGKTAGMTSLWLYIIGGAGAASALTALFTHFFGK